MSHGGGGLSWVADASWGLLSSVHSNWTAPGVVNTCLIRPRRNNTLKTYRCVLANADYQEQALAARLLPLVETYPREGHQTSSRP